MLVKVETDARIPMGEFRGISVKQGKDVTDDFH
jgi:hypothetical protein